jgi:thiamine monophosphate kinase
LYATGFLGAANVAAFLGRPVPEPALRDPVPGNALFATDTSGGLFDALENFRRVNPGVWLELDAERAVSPEVARSLPPGVEKGWALVGGVGEYELLFAVPRGVRVDGAIRVGRGGFGDPARGGEVRVVCGAKTGRLVAPPPDYRALPRENWLTETAAYWASLWAL